jgi:type I restriction enzyme S subunit
MVLPNSLSSYYEKFLATGEVKCIDEEIPFEIPATWEWARFSTIINMSPTVSAEDDVDAAFMPMALINAGYGSGYSYETKKWSLIKTGFTKIAVGDIAYAKITPCFQNRKSFILEDVPGKVAAATTELNVLRLYGQTLYAWYVLYFLKSDYFIKEAKYKGTAGQQRVLSSYVQNKLFPIPPYNEQYRIIGKVQDVFPIVDRYEKSQQGLDKLNALIFDSLKKSILQEAIQGKLVPQIAEEGTAQELLEQIRQEKQKLVKEGKLKNSALIDSVIYKGDDNKYYEQVGNENIDITEEIPFDLPENWTWVRFGQYVRMSIGKTPPRGETKYWANGKYPWVSISDMSDYGLVTTTKESVSEYAKSLFGEISPVGTLIMSFKLTVGRTSLLNTSAYHNEAIISIYPFVDKNYQARNFLFHILPIISNLGDTKDAIKGKTLNSKSLNNLLLPLPPLNEQGRIMAMIELLFDKLK